MKKIIVADSILGVVEQAGTLFGRGGIELIRARSSEEILELHGSQKAHLIITDSDLPAMGGAKLCSAIRGFAGLKDVSIIMVCDAGQAHRGKCDDIGANAVIPKPVDPVVLFAKVSELIAVPHRKDMRVLLQVSVTAGAEAPSLFASSSNISISGMLMETSDPLAKGQRVHCSFTIGHNRISVECEVRRVERTAAERYRSGVRFLNLDTRSLIIIEQFVKNRIAP